MDFSEGVNFFRADCFGAGLLTVVPPGGRLLDMAGTVSGACCPTSAPDPEESVFVSNLLVFCAGASVLARCLVGCAGSGISVACLTVAGGILALKIVNFSPGGWLSWGWVAGDRAGNIFEITNCRR